MKRRKKARKKSISRQAKLNRLAKLKSIVSRMTPGNGTAKVFQRGIERLERDLSK